MAATTNTTLYHVRIYTADDYNGKAVGEVRLTDDQYKRYESLAGNPEGVISLGNLPHDLYELYEDWQHLPESTIVYLN